MRINIFWFRRDLRLNDNAGLYHSLKNGIPVLPIFIFDIQILSELPDKTDARVSFIHSSISDLKNELIAVGSDLDVRYGNPVEIWEDLIGEHQINEVYANHDYDSYSINRDNEIKNILKKNNIPFNTFKDHVIFEKEEVVKKDGNPYTVFTPYKKKWLEKIALSKKREEGSFYLQSYHTKKYLHNLLKFNILNHIPSLDDIGFKKSKIIIPGKIVPDKIIIKYHENRDFPSSSGTSRLGIHFRFGTVSIREKANKAMNLNPTYLSELIWRDFYNMILYYFPYVEKSAFRPQYNYIKWRNDENEFEAWCQGRTGYPIVDAGMRELLATGFMHNRVRMITASFLTKHLLIDWRWGESWFAEKLLDYDLASNNGGWQWAAGCGTDAAPYFRIFSPDAQTKKFDKSKEYIEKWVPEVHSDQYPDPIVDHRKARERCLETYKKALSKPNV